MATIGYYKLKEDLSELVKNEIAARLQTERDLQQKYIGLGLKIAAAGAAVAVFSIGFLGVKSSFDISSAISDTTKNIEKKIETEITNQFNEKNPVRTYQSMLIGASARAIVASIDIQAAKNDRRGMLLDEKTIEAINTILRSIELKSDVKREVINVLVRANIRDQGPGATTDLIILNLLKENTKSDHVDDAALAIACIRYLAHRTARAVTAELGRIYDQHRNEKSISIAVAQYAFELDQDSGERLISALESSNDDEIRYLMHMRRLRLEKNARVDGDLLKRILPSIFEANFGSRSLRPVEVLKQIRAISEDTDNSTLVTQLMDVLREYAVSRGLEFAISRASFDGQGFFGFIGPRTRLAMPRDVFNDFFVLAMSLFVQSIEDNGGIIKNDDLTRLAYWIPKYATRSRGDNTHPRLFGAIAVMPSQNMTFITSQNDKIQRSALDGRVMLRVSSSGEKRQLLLSWREPSGELRTAGIIEIQNVDRDSFEAHGPWNRATPDDEE